MLIGKKVLNKTASRFSDKSSEKNFDRKVWYCPLYQRNKCYISKDGHNLEIAGKSRFVQHICATCLREDKAKMKHPEKFGFPIGYTAGDIVDIKTPRNLGGARDFTDFILKYLKKELEYKAVIGPLKVNPFIYSSLVLFPLNSVPKSTPCERRVILDLSFPSENCINAGIDKDIYLGESVNLTYPSVDDFINLIKLKGRHCGIFKRDLKRAYRQIPIDPGDINFVGFHWKNHIFVDRVLSMGLRSSAHICQRVTSSVVYMMKQSGYLLLNYLDEFARVEKSEDGNFVFDLLGRLLDSLLMIGHLL
ncbi:unnamed protein product [Mytilus coruscus]|uniref:Reverse transcriptase domain-containing protein n=1 Tax=Mytilus coruscus TaxID=42192 RepID=A0A6J8EG82_MYTCO|nr:unnamed protein product [Mytilus coruscus]